MRAVLRWKDVAYATGGANYHIWMPADSTSSSMRRKLWEDANLKFNLHLLRH
jgi:hypothetical protein